MRITQDNTVLLLTACVNPGGMSYTLVQNPKEREEQYVSAIQYYIDNTHFKILVVENTGVDLEHYFNCEPRLEFLSFNGNDYNKLLGKGYGEGQILKYAYDFSRFISDCSFVVKITGRHIVTNLNQIVFLLNASGKISNCFFSGVVYKDLFEIISDCYICSSEFYPEFLLKNIEECNDSKGVYFEHILFKSFLSAQEKRHYRFIPFPLPISQSGVSGSGNYCFKRHSMKIKICYFLKFILWNLKPTCPTIQKDI